MAFVNQKNPFPVNTSKAPDGWNANQPTSQDLKLVWLAIIAAGNPTALANAEQLNINVVSSVSTNFAPSVFSVLNPEGNNGTVTVVLVTTEGDVSLTINAGDTLTLPYYKGLTYSVGTITNNGLEEGGLTAIYYGLLYT